MKVLQNVYISLPCIQSTRTDGIDRSEEMILCPSFRIRGQLPAPIVNGGGYSFWKWQDFQLSRTRDLDLDIGSGHTAYRRASLIDLSLHSKFHWNQRNFPWTNGRLRPTLLGWLRWAAIKMGHVNMTTPLLGVVCHLYARIWHILPVCKIWRF